MGFSDTGQGDRNEDTQEPAGGPPREGEAFENTGFENEGQFDQPPQLDLGDEDVRLPWLEGEDDEFEEQGRSSMGQGLLLAVLGLVAIALIAGGVFWTLRKPERQLVADGGVIAAPKEPYKTRPQNPGGEVVAGTGDTSFAVAEGQSRQPRIDDKDETPQPGFVSVDKRVKQTPSAQPTEAAVSGVGVQVGAYASRDTAEAGWNTLKTQYPDLSGIKHRIVEGKADIGTVYRLQAVPGDLAAAKALCSGMKSAGLSCQVKQ
ncbi:MAG TPA: SPOR domain-containing protein [Novosphingobium sp.]|nr:SPOR domain-containing protein [Novosphingobium sp.]